MTNEEAVLKQINRGNKKYSLQKEIIMTDEQKEQHIRIVAQAIDVLTKQIMNMLYTQARMSTSLVFLMGHSTDAIRDSRKTLDDDFFVAQQIIEMDQIK